MTEWCVLEHRDGDYAIMTEINHPSLACSLPKYKGTKLLSLGRYKELKANGKPCAGHLVMFFVMTAPIDPDESPLK